MPDEAEELFRAELKCSRKPLQKDRDDRKQWRFACVCAVTRAGHVLGGVYLDIGPINFGPLAKEKLAFVERIFVRPDYRRHGIGARLLHRGITVAREAGCLHIQCNVGWDNPTGLALFRKCGFALVDIAEDGGEYFAVKPLQKGET